MKSVILSRRVPSSCKNPDKALADRPLVPIFCDRKLSEKSPATLLIGDWNRNLQYARDTMRDQSSGKISLSRSRHGFCSFRMYSESPYSLTSPIRGSSSFTGFPLFSSSISRSIILLRDSLKPPASVIEPRYLPVILRARFFSLSYTLLHSYSL